MDCGRGRWGVIVLTDSCETGAAIARWWGLRAGCEPHTPR